MTFCLGMRVRAGLVAIADTRITAGNTIISARKLTTHRSGGHPFFLMTSGLRSVRDKALTYFEEALDHQPEEGFDRMFKAVNAFAGQLRRVADEDRNALYESGLIFNLHALIGGRMTADREHKLYMVYPQGNWIEIGPGTPYCIIGESGYGKPVLDRTLHFDDDLEHALKVGCLAFESTRLSASDVDYPIDVAVLGTDGRSIAEQRYGQEVLKRVSAWWQERLRAGVKELPADWTAAIIERLGAPPAGG